LARLAHLSGPTEGLTNHMGQIKDYFFIRRHPDE
jgi:hypothetical protein